MKKRKYIFGFLIALGVVLLWVVLEATYVLGQRDVELTIPVTIYEGTAPIGETSLAVEGTFRGSVFATDDHFYGTISTAYIPETSQDGVMTKLQWHEYFYENNIFLNLMTYCTLEYHHENELLVPTELPVVEGVYASRDFEQIAIDYGDVVLSNSLEALDACRATS